MSRAETHADTHGRLIDAEIAAFHLLRKFHKETHCGRPYHWAECDRLVDVFGWRSWQAWVWVAESDPEWYLK